jgi:hypothetical protein
VPSVYVSKDAYDRLVRDGKDPSRVVAQLLEEYLGPEPAPPKGAKQ